MRKFMKKRKEETANLTTDELIATFKAAKLFPNKWFKGVAIVLAAFFVAGAVVSVDKLKTVSTDGEDLIAMATNPVAATSGKKDLISIPSGVVKANPFLPYRNIGDSIYKDLDVADVPKYDLVEPPEVINENSDAARVMDTVVSGILYDKYSPSAILNIEGNDYLVKKGDVVNNYKVLAIAQDSVTVKLGSNTYKAGIGEILTEGSVNLNEVSNLNNKFGGKK